MQRVAPGERREAGDDRVEVGERERGRQRHREQREPRRGAHRREIAEVDRERAVTNRVGRDERAIEMNALDQRIDRQHLDPVALGLDHRRVVADPDQQPLGRGRQAFADARDELALSHASDRRYHTTPVR